MLIHILIHLSKLVSLRGSCRGYDYVFWESYLLFAMIIVLSVTEKSPTLFSFLLWFIIVLEKKLPTGIHGKTKIFHPLLSYPGDHCNVQINAELLDRYLV